MSIMKFVIILIGMIWCHIIDDYILQTTPLVNMKQKDWWTKITDKDMYKNDYKAALLCHAFSWSCSISVIPLVYTIINRDSIPHLEGILFLLVLMFLANLITHYNVDDLKANKKLINLVVDQSIHLGQVLFTFIMWVCTIHI